MRSKNTTNRFGMQTERRGRSPFAATHLSIPRLSGMAPKIVADNHLNEICHILAAIDRFRPVGPYLRSNNHLEVLAAVLESWVNDIIPADIQTEFPFEIDVLYPDNSRDELDITEGHIAFLFHLDEFNNRDMYIQKTLDEYERRQPGLGKLLVALLSCSPINLGTPADVYDMTSWTFWGGEENENSRMEELREEFSSETDDEDDIQCSLEMYIPVRYEHFLNNFPEWMFQRNSETFDQKWDIPDELRPLYQAVIEYKKLDGKHNHNYPRGNLPVILTTLDDDRFDFSLDILNQSGQDTMECGDMFYFSSCAWELNPNDPNQLSNGLADFECSLAIFREAIRFLLLKNPARTEEKAA